MSRNAAGELVLGINFYRSSPHTGEVSNWSPRLPTVSAVISRFNELRGIDLSGRPSQLEITPYVGARSASAPERTGDASSASLPRGTSAVAGVDARVALPGGFALAATIHPDFGQVEADPSLVNLTSFEIVFPGAAPVFHRGCGRVHFQWGQRGSGCRSRRARMRSRARVRSIAAASVARRTWGRSPTTRASSTFPDPPPYSARQSSWVARVMDGLRAPSMRRRAPSAHRSFAPAPAGAASSSSRPRSSRWDASLATFAAARAPPVRCSRPCTDSCRGMIRQGCRRPRSLRGSMGAIAFAAETSKHRDSCQRAA